MMPRAIYEKFVKGYTEKQWGVPATMLSASLAKRFDVREDDEPRLMRHRFQGIPENGYAKFMAEILKGIPIITNCDFLKHRSELGAEKMMIFTGPLDEYFDFDLGKLSYRGQRRDQKYLPDVDWVQPCVQVNNPNPDNGAHIRTIEWKHLLAPEYAASVRGTVLTVESTITPINPNEYEYPFPDETNASLYKLYADRARMIPNLLVCGRLGEYRYYDMDQAIARAQLVSERILDGQCSHRV